VAEEKGKVKVEKREGRRQIGRPRRRWEHKIVTDVR